jgi:NAD-dependent deacetylase
MVPLMDAAAKYASQADIFLVVGTSMAVYPAAGLINYVRDDAPKFIVDPKIPDLGRLPHITLIPEKASSGMAKLRDILMKFR